jgi:hypothetical protein
MGKLTRLQRKTLTDIAESAVHNVKGGYGAWRIRGAQPSVVGRLISMGLAKWGPFDPESIVCIITEAGKATLSHEGAA